MAMRAYETPIETLMGAARREPGATEQKLQNAQADLNGDDVSDADQLEQQEEAAAAAIDQYVLAARAARRAAAASQSSGEDAAVGEAATASAVGRNEVERPIAEAAPVTEIAASEPVTENCPVTEAAIMRVAGNGDQRRGAPKFSAPASRLDERTTALVTPTRAAPVEVPQHIVEQLRPKHRPVIRITWRRLPVIAGENASDYFELLNSVVEEWKPLTLEQCLLVKQTADSEWAAIQFQEYRVWLFNAAIAAGLVAQIVDAEIENGGDASDRIVHQDPGLEPCVHQGWLRSVRRVTSAAVAGDQDAIAKIEARIGPDQIGMGPLCVREVERSVPTYLFADRMLNAALARRDNALRRLVKLAAERNTRIEAKQATVADLSLPEYVRSKIGPTSAERAELSFYAAREAKQIATAANATDKSGSES
jgi:hypothetical protein